MLGEKFCNSNFVIHHVKKIAINECIFKDNQNWEKLEFHYAPADHHT